MQWGRKRHPMTILPTVSCVLGSSSATQEHQKTAITLVRQEHTFSTLGVCACVCVCECVCVFMCVCMCVYICVCVCVCVLNVTA